MCILFVLSCVLFCTVLAGAEYGLPISTMYLLYNPNKTRLNNPYSDCIVNLQLYNDVIMKAMAFQITSLTIVHSTVYSRRRSKKTTKLRVTGLCAWNSPVTGEFPAQMASNAEIVFIWWRHHENKSMGIYHHPGQCTSQEIYTQFPLFWVLFRFGTTRFHAYPSGLHN